MFRKQQNCQEYFTIDFKSIFNELTNAESICILAYVNNFLVLFQKGCVHTQTFGKRKKYSAFGGIVFVSVESTVAACKLFITFFFFTSFSLISFRYLESYFGDPLSSTFLSKFVPNGLHSKTPSRLFIL